MCKEKSADTEKNIELPDAVSNIKIAEAKLFKDKLVRDLRIVEMFIGGCALTEISSETGITKQKISSFISRGLQQIRLKSAEHETVQSASKAITLKPIWPENLYCAVFKTKAYNETPIDAEESIELLLRHITNREKIIIVGRFKYEQDYQELADMFDLSRERIRQIEAKTLKKLRHPQRAKYLVNGLTIQESEDAKERMSRLIAVKERVKRTDEVIAEQKIRFDELESFADIELERLNLGVRSYNCLSRAGIRTLDDLLCYTAEDLFKIRNFGRRSLEEVVAACKKAGIEIKYDDCDIAPKA